MNNTDLKTTQNNRAPGRNKIGVGLWLPGTAGQLPGGEMMLPGGGDVLPDGGREELAKNALFIAYHFCQ